jgi:hypothetical protein
MSLLVNLHELQQRLAGDHKQARERWAEGGEGGDMEPEVIDGVTVVIKYEGSNRNTDYRTVLLDGYHFAREAETIPWSVFKDITVSYTCFTFLTEATLKALLQELNLTKEFDIVEEWYPADDGIVRYNCCTLELEHVVTLWKTWNARYKAEVETIV